MIESRQHASDAAGYDELDLRGLVRDLWAGKWQIGGISVVVAVASIVVAFILPNVYRAEALLAPNDPNDLGGLSTLAAQYGGLASLAGFNLDGGATDKTALGLEVLKSRKFLSEFIERHDLLVPLMAADGWNPESDELQIDPDDYDVETGMWVRDVSYSKKSVPSSQEAYEQFLENFSARQDSKSGFVTVSVDHVSPAVAKQWVDWLVEDINAMIMRQDVARAEQAIAYLDDQLRNTSLVELQSVFFGLIEEQMKTVLLAKVSPEYLFRTVDPAVIPERKHRPRRVMIVVLSTLIGALAGMLFVLGRRNASAEAEV